MEFDQPESLLIANKKNDYLFLSQHISKPHVRRFNVNQKIFCLNKYVKYICHFGKLNCQMESKINQNKIALLPKYFKIIGLAIMILAFVATVFVKSMNVEMVQTQKILFRIFTLNTFILGLFFIAWSKDEVEDEMTVVIRLKAMGWTFGWAVLYVIIKPIVDLVFKEPIQDLTGQQVVMSMLFAYLIMYYLQKIGR